MLRQLTAIVAALLLLSSCGARGSVPESQAGPADPALAGPATPSSYTKVMVIAEENEEYSKVIGHPRAPFINKLAKSHGFARRMTAGYQRRCPSLPAYLLLTSGSTHDICDDRDARVHTIPGDNIFRQVATAGLQWRGYAESMPYPCAHRNTGDHVYLVRHAPAPYFVSERSRCPLWDLPLGTPSAGALHDDLARGRLPAYSFVTPDACHDMHGAGACQSGMVAAGDDWLARWVPQILNSPDYRSGRLAVFITWDEGSAHDNHIPALVLSPTTTRIAATRDYTHCSLLRTVEEILRLPTLSCARTARSMRQEFHL